MLTQYLKIAFRNLRKHQARALIAILGLAFAVACFVPALYWVEYEKNYDSFYPDASDIYRVYTFDKQKREGKQSRLWHFVAGTQRTLPGNARRDSFLR